MRQTGRLVPDPFFKILYMRQKQVVSNLAAIYFGSPPLGLPIKRNCIKFQSVGPKICSILIFFEKGLDYFLQPMLCVIFQEKYS